MKHFTMFADCRAGEKTISRASSSLKAFALSLMFAICGLSSNAQTVWDVIVNSPDHNTLEAAVLAAGLEGALSDSTASLTVFAPNDAAFAAMPPGAVSALLADPAGDLTTVLLYHVVGAEAFSSSLVDGQQIATLQGQNVFIGVTESSVTVNGSPVLAADVDASNGVVHVIGAVLLPPAVISSNGINCPADVIIECGQSIFDFDLTGYPTLNNTYAGASISYSDALISSGSCNVVYARTWSASFTHCANGFVVSGATCTQIITVRDTEGPVLNGFQASIEVQCQEDKPEFAFVTANDVCSGEESVTMWESHTGRADQTCNLSTAFGPGADWALWLPDMSAAGDAASANWVFDANGGKFEQYVDGTARLFGRVINTNNPTQAFIVDMWFEGRTNFTDWTAMGREYKNDLGLACANNNVESWLFYEMKSGISTLTGDGALAGDILYLSHMPSNFYFGFQYGIGANNKNCNEGISGWFTYEGFINGEGVQGHGDVNADADCSTPSYVCDNNDNYTYIYSAMDNCGNCTIGKSMIVINDTTAPTFLNCPTPVTQECSDALPAVAEGIEAQDNCIGDVTVNYVGEESETDGCTTWITRTWEAIDACGNRSECSQVITLIDTTNPVFNDYDHYISTECDVEPEWPTATDNCDTDVTITIAGEVLNSGGCLGVLARTYRATDNCGNFVEVVQYIALLDTTAPTFENVPADNTVQCNTVSLGENGLYFSAGSVVGVDNCELEVTVTYSEQVVLTDDNCPNSYNIVRTWTGTDFCENVATISRTTSVIDSTDPIYTSFPDDLTIACTDPIPAVVFPIATDNCDDQVTITLTTDQVAGDCPQEYTIMRVFRGTDNCGNEVVETQEIHVVDEVAPVLSGLPAAQITAQCDNVPAPANVTIADNCDDEPTLNYVQNITPGSCTDSYTITRTWTGTDACSNTTVFVQTITVVDTTNPVLAGTPSANITVECNAVPAAATVTATDNCDTSVNLQYNQTRTNGSCEFNYTLTRTWTATDNCGNQTVFVQTINVQDTQAPVITGAFEITRPCDDIDGRYVEATDNCGDISWDWTDIHVSGGCVGTVVRTYVATDECGNDSAPFEQTIHLTDVVAPTFTTTEDITIQCDDLVPAVTAPVFSDNCDDMLEIEYAYNEEVLSICSTDLVYTWTATDNCGNSTVAVKRIHVVDTEAPIFVEGTFPVDLFLECDSEIPAIQYPVYEDNCDDFADLQMIQDTFPGCGNSLILTRTYTIWDICGNSDTRVQTIYFQDVIAPEFGEGQVTAYTYECDQTVPVIQPTAADNCAGASDITFSYVDVTVNNNPCNTVIERRWTAVDECDNDAMFTQVITLVDTTAPVITGELSISRPCNNYNGVYALATDNCNSITWSSYDEPVSGACGGNVIRHYTATDACGNASAEFIQIIQLVDDVAPTANPISNVTVQCNQTVPTYTPNWNDNCDDELETTFVQSETTGDECSSTYTQTWTATDNCDNTTVRTRTVTIVDTTDPVFAGVPSSATFDCDFEGDITLASPTATDNCDEEVEVSLVVTTTAGSCPAEMVYTYTWTAVDDCGNDRVVTRTVTIVDNEGPDFTSGLQTSYQFECGSSYATPAPTATDNCSTVASITSVDGPVNYSSNCNGSFARTWTATDACGNNSNFVQLITFVDTTDPVLAGCPSDIVLDCSADAPAAANVTASDACDSNVDLDFDEFWIGDTPAPGSIEDCKLITAALPADNPCGYPADWGVALFNMPINYRYYEIVDGNWVRYADRVEVTLHIQPVQLGSTPQINGGWDVSMEFDNGSTAEEWFSGIHGFKADCGGVAANANEWEYFILQEGASMTGWGAFAGSSLSLAHAPVNEYFGYQLGAGANNYNAAEEGFGGWFTYSGTFRPSQSVEPSNVAGAGDVCVERDCCPRYEIRRQWTATDCAGNSTTCTQVISWSHSVATGNAGSNVANNYAVETGRVASITAQPNPANNNTLFTFRAANTAKTSVEIYDLTGKKVADVFVGSVEAGAEYRVDFNVSNLATGVYTYRLTNGSEVKIDRLIISK
jgi:uncharacterized surface protein with fasciclin (FAS1) repeats